MRIDLGKRLSKRLVVKSGMDTAENGRGIRSGKLRLPLLQCAIAKNAPAKRTTIEPYHEAEPGKHGERQRRGGEGVEKERRRVRQNFPSNISEKYLMQFNVSIRLLAWVIQRMLAGLPRARPRPEGTFYLLRRCCDCFRRCDHARLAARLHALQS